MDQILKINQTLDFGEDASASFTPDAGAKIIIKEIYAEVPGSSGTTTKVIWRFQHGSEPEEVIWSIRRSGEMPFQEEISDCDGIRQIGIVVENNEINSPQFCSVYARIQIL